MMARGFSLVELSIVLVILGLLTGGILTGQNLIRAAELRSVVTEFQTYQTAVQTFRDKYFALPGDMTNATSFWTQAANCPGTSAQGTGSVSTCDGNGNGLLDSTTISNEQFRAWQHLAMAGLVAGTYEGVEGGSGAAHHIGGFNAPQSKIAQGVWALKHRTHTGDGNFFDGDYGNTLQLGGQRATNGSPYEPIFTPAEAWGIDKKIDDGIPSRGILWSVHWNDKCSTAVTGTTASNNFDTQYRLDDATLQCALVTHHVF
jgi:prepilin-type N-terminal cleavage/methylation domain-containing protein